MHDHEVIGVQVFVCICAGILVVLVLLRICFAVLTNLVTALNVTRSVLLVCLTTSLQIEKIKYPPYVNSFKWM